MNASTVKADMGLFDRAVSAYSIRRVIKEQMGLTWQRVKPRYVYENSERNLVLRQTFGVELIEAKLDGKFLLNFDECSFTVMNNKNYSFAAKKRTNKRNLKLLSKTLHLFLAVANDGLLVFSYMVGTNNQSTFTHFLQQLINYLSAKVPDFRSKYILLLDNCPVHTSGAV